MSQRIDPGAPENAQRISMGDDKDFAYWCEELGCLPAELREIIAEVGNLVADVRARLRQ
jgi:hypothetical protein